MIEAHIHTDSKASGCSEVSVQRLTEEDEVLACVCFLDRELSCGHDQAPVDSEENKSSDQLVTLL